MCKKSKYSIIIFLLLLIGVEGSAQRNTLRKTEVQLAHDDKSEYASFQSSDHHLFQVRVFSIKVPKVNKQHHWYIQVLDDKGVPVNLASLTMEAYLKEDKSIQLNYMAPVFTLCSEGKYIIGFINSKRSGIWQLDVAIDDFGKKDQVSLEMEIGL